MSLSSSQATNQHVMRKVVSVIALATVIMSTMFIAAPVSAVTTDTSAVKAILMLSPDTGNFAVGETFSVQILLDTKGVEVSQVDFKLKYDADALEVQDSDRDRAGIQIKDGDLFEVLLSTTPVDTRAGAIEYSKIALSEGKYYKTTGEPGKVATIDFKVLKEGPTTVRFETSDTAPVPTKIYRAIDEEQILGEVTNAEFTVSGQATVTAQQTPTASVNGRSSISMVIDKVNLKADGIDKASVRVSVKDKDGNPVPTSKIVFGVTGSAILTPLTATTDATGQVSATLTAGTQAGNISISAHLESDPTVSTTTQIVASAAQATPAPTTTTTARPTLPSTPQPVTPPADLDDVGPMSTIPTFAISLLAAYLLTFRTSFARKRKS